MLLFSTLLDINEKMSRERFFDLICEWNDTQFYEENKIPDLKWDGKYGTRHGTDDLWIRFEQYESILAARYEKKKDGVVWDTEYVMNFRNMKMSVRLERSYSEDALTLDGKFSTPNIIALLIDKGYLKKDSDLQVKKEATYIDEDNVSFLADVVNVEKKYNLPVVYVSRNFHNEEPVDITALARRLKGIAHILVQSDIKSNKAIMNACSGKNEYKGGIGIYFPGAGIGHKSFKYRRENGEDPQLLEKIVQTVFQYTNSQAVEPMFTLQGVYNALLRQSLDNQSKARENFENAWKESEKARKDLQDNLDEEEQRIAKEAANKARSEADELLELFDEEQKALNARIKELTDKNEALQRENDGLRSKLQNLSGVPLLMRGDEYDIFEGEIKDFVLSTLKDALASTEEGTRRYDAIKDVFESNGYQNLCGEKADRLKRMLKAYNGMSSKLKQDLEALGFEIREDGKHYKVLYNGEQRYIQTMSKTPSDWRTGKISSTELSKLAF